MATKKTAKAPSRPQIKQHGLPKVRSIPKVSKGSGKTGAPK
jgi:hypothetical protein